MLLLPIILGTNRVMSRPSVTCSIRSWSAEYALTAIGTSCTLSARRWAVTITSSISWSLSCAIAGAIIAMPASARVNLQMNFIRRVPLRFSVGTGAIRAKNPPAPCNSDRKRVVLTLYTGLIYGPLRSIQVAAPLAASPGVAGSVCIGGVFVPVFCAGCRAEGFGNSSIPRRVNANGEPVRRHPGNQGRPSGG